MTIRILAFAQAREALGASSLELELPPGSRVSDALRTLVSSAPTLAPIAAHLALAVGEELSDGSRELRDGDELALLPPVSGG
ncbi:MAG: MoaD/ThiS family protein [Candidatus Eisenbacteria bacterium]|uniref:Molybdopterin synthase sulfur carrier subunit n=1 Tax=Eiseniibacteriota bacterium TaxID=2212470 RepID=A0A849T330_UNCEI|nr:MoaD/ThiS family protein [Candidatus Eisenbacteria bacterium]